MVYHLVVFPEQKVLTFKKHILRHVNKNPQEESCGIIYCDVNKIKYEPVDNISSNKFNSFLIDKKIFATFNSKEILAIFHSHPKGDEAPSQDDLVTCEKIAIPYYIYSLQKKKFSLIYPESYKPLNLMGRIFLPEFQDCVTLVKDFFDIELNIKLSKFVKNWARRRHNNSNKDLISILDSNFYEVNEVKNAGDVVVFDMKNNLPFHLGVFSKSKKIIHQPNDQLSQEVYLTPELMKKVYKIYRYKDL